MYSTTANSRIGIATFARWLNVPPIGLVIFLNENSHYRKFKIKKSSGGFRTIDAPDEGLKKIQRRLNGLLQACYNTHLPASSHGFIKRFGEINNPSRSIHSNAQMHVGKHQVLNLDLKDFFHSIDIYRVREFFMHNFNTNFEAASVLAALVCHEGRLPMGAPTSPVMANLICLPLDRQLERLARRHQLTYTRYADDLTFSGDCIEDKMLNEIKTIITNERFTINETKVRLQISKSKQVVTGIKVNTRTNVERSYIKNLRAAFHDLHLHPHQKSDLTLKRSLRGRIDYLKQVRGWDDPIHKKFHWLFEEYYKA